MAAARDKLNQLLLESKERVAVIETLTIVPGSLKKLPVKEDGDDGGMYEAKVGHADRVLGNPRVYPREAWQKNIDRLKPILKDGMLCGGVDHGTGLDKQCMMWKDLRMEDDGGVYGKFSIVPTSAGKDFEIQCNSGMAVGFSTYGYGNAHAPSDEEKAKYNIDPDDGNVVVMNTDYELVKIDGVDDPSCHDARLQQNSRREATATAESCSNGLHDKRVHVGPPPLAGRTAYLQKKLGKVETPEEIESLAKATDGLSFGHLRELITAVYALKEPKSDVLSRLKGSKPNKQSDSKSESVDKSTRLTNQMGVIAEGGDSIHLNHAAVSHAMEAIRAGKIDHGSFDGDKVERDAANSDKFLGIDSAAKPDEKSHYKFPIFTGEKVSVKGVGTAGHYAEGTHPEIHAATVKLSEAIKEHDGGKAGATKDSKMSEKNPVVESINAMLATLSQAQVEGLNLPQKEVLPAEFKEQLDAVKSELVAEQAKVATLTQEKAELQKVIDAAKAEKANAERIAKVTAKAGESLKDNRFAKPIAKQIEALAKTDASFDESKVAAFVAAKVGEYEEAVGGVVVKHGNLTTDDLGSNIGDPEIDELEEQLEIGNETNVFEAVEPAAELNFGRKPKVAAAK